MFRPLSKDNIAGIIKLLMEDLNKRLASREIKIELNKEAEQFIIDNGYDPNFGARPLKRYLQKSVETLAARKILSNTLRTGDTMLVEVEGKKLVIK